MSKELDRTLFTPARRRQRRRPRLGEREHGRGGQPDRGGGHEPAPPRSDRPDVDAHGRTARENTARVERSAGRVLVVDDEHAIRLVCRVNLSSAGFETLEAPDGATALLLARSEQPDLILLDIMLPALDGWRVAEELRDDAKTHDIPILFLSARSEHADLQRGYELGGLGFVTKPFDAAELPKIVSQTLDAVRRGERESVRRAWLHELGDD